MSCMFYILYQAPLVLVLSLKKKNFRVFWVSFFPFFFVLAVSTGGDDGELLGPDGVDPRVKHGLSSKSTSARVACEPVVRIPVYYWLLSVVSSGGRGWYHLFWSVASASGTFLPVGLLLPTGRPFPPTSGPVISRQWTFSYSRRLPVAGCRLPVASCQPPVLLPLAGPFISLVGDIYPTGRTFASCCFLLLLPGNPMVPFLPQNCRLCCVLKTPRRKPIRLTRSPTWAPAKRPHQPIREAKVCARAKTNPAHKTGQCSKCAPEKGQTSPTRKAKVCARRKGQTSPQERPKYVPEEKGKPAHKKGQSMCHKKRANRPTRKAKVCARKKDKPVRKKGQSRRQSKHQSGPQERLMLQMRAREKRLFRDPQGHCQDSKPNQDR
ncbi:hypothetical protein F4703DRAFT_1964114 [Phycomyces blakesleeanus]